MECGKKHDLKVVLMYSRSRPCHQLTESCSGPHFRESSTDHLFWHSPRPDELILFPTAVDEMASKQCLLHVETRKAYPTSRIPLSNTTGRK